MAYKWGLLTTYDTWDDPPSTDNVSLYFPHKLLTLGKRAMITYGEGLALVFISPATQKLSPGLVVCKYHLQIRKKPGIRSCSNKNSTPKRGKKDAIQGYTGGEIYDVYFKPCNGSAPVKLGPPKETIIFQIVPGCKPRKKHGREYKLGIGDLTLPETDIAPARKPSQQEISFSNHQFSVDMLGFQGGIVGVFA